METIYIDIDARHIEDKFDDVAAIKAVEFNVYRDGFDDAHMETHVETWHPDIICRVDLRQTPVKDSPAMVTLMQKPDKFTHDYNEDCEIEVDLTFELLGFHDGGIAHVAAEVTGANIR